MRNLEWKSKRERKANKTRVFPPHVHRTAYCGADILHSKSLTFCDLFASLRTLHFTRRNAEFHIQVSIHSQCGTMNTVAEHHWRSIRGATPSKSFTSPFSYILGGKQVKCFFPSLYELGYIFSVRAKGFRCRDKVSRTRRHQRCHTCWEPQFNS